MKNKIKISLLITLLLSSNNLLAEDLWKKYKPSSVGDVEKIYDKFDSDKPKRKSNNNVGTANWSLVNEDCTFDKDLLFDDSMDRLQEHYQGVFDNLLENGKELFTNHMAMRETCNTIATGKCISGDMYNYMNYQEVNLKTSECLVDNGKDITKINNASDKGTDWVGCNVQPLDTTPAPPFVTYPYPANSTVIFVPCPPNVPKYTPFLVSTSLTINTQSIDNASLNATMTCQTNIWNEARSDAFDRCQEKELKSCNDFITQHGTIGVNQSLEKLAIEDSKCIIDKQFVDKEQKELMYKKLENTKLLNNQVIRNGKVVILDEKEKKLSFKPNIDDELDLKREVLDTCISILKSDTFEGEINTIDYDTVKEFCLDYKENEMSEDFVMEQLKNIKSNFYSNPKIYMAEFEILYSYVKEWKDITYTKFQKQIDYNPMEIIQNSDRQEKLINELNLQTKNFSKSYDIYSTKYDLLIEHINKMISKFKKEFKKNTSRITISI